MGGRGLVDSSGYDEAATRHQRQGLTPGSNHRRTHEMHASSSRKGREGATRSLSPQHALHPPHHHAAPSPYHHEPPPLAAAASSAEDSESSETVTGTRP